MGDKLYIFNVIYNLLKLNGDCFYRLRLWAEVYIYIYLVLSNY